MSRKTLALIIAVFGAILGVFATTFGLAINQTAVLTGVAALAVYIFGEAKADIRRIGTQADKFKDPKFLISIISAIIAALAGAGLTLPISPEAIIAVLTVIVGILFKVKKPA